MDKKEIYNYLKNTLKISNIKIDEPMFKHTSFKIGGPADIFITANSIKEIKSILKFAKENNIKIFVIGNGSNLLVKDEGIRGIVLKINLNDIKIEKVEDEKQSRANIIVGAGVKLGFLANELLKNNISGFEFACRNTRNYRWCYQNECRCLWRRIKRYSCINKMY